MRKLIILLITILLSGALNCSQEQKKDHKKQFDLSSTQEGEENLKKGNLQLKIADLTKTRTSEPGIKMERRNFIISGKCEDGSTFDLEPTEETDILITGLIPGKWTIDVEADNSDSIFIAYGRGEIDVIFDETNTIEIAVIPYNGFGEIELSISWEAALVTDPRLEGKIAGESGIPQEVLFEIEGNTATAIITMATGYYVLQLNLYDQTKPMTTYIGGTVEVVRVLKNETTSGDYAILSNPDYGYADVDLNILINLKLPVDIELSGIHEKFYKGRTMVITASAQNDPDEANLSYTWHINGLKVGEGETYTTKDNLPPGNYQLDVVAFNQTRDRGGSLKYNFEVIYVIPENLIITSAGPSSAEISWDNNITIEDGYKIERKCEGDFVEIGATAADVTTYTDTNLSPESGYTYRVRAYWLNVETDYSNEVHLIQAQQTLSYNNPVIYTIDTEITPNTPGLDVDDQVTYSVSPGLPAGLTFDAQTGTISGTPASELEETIYTVTASNLRDSVSTDITITINYTAPISLSYSSNSLELTVDQTMTACVAALEGEYRGIIYSVTPELPTGLSINTSAGNITGTPLQETDPENYVVTAANSGGSVSDTLVIEVKYDAPISLSYDSNTIDCTVGQEILENIASVQGESRGLSYTVIPALPAGLIINTSTGTISGTPTQETMESVYTVTATNSGGSVSDTLTITVNFAAPTSLDYSSNPLIITADQAMTPCTATIAGEDRGIEFSISPMLSPGLDFDTNSGAITGTPTQGPSQANYVVTATNSGGSVSKSLIIKINYPAPGSLNYSDSSAELTVDQVMVPLSATISGESRGILYTVSPTLPAGLSLDLLSGTIDGTPTEETEQTSYIVTAENSGGTVTESVIITVNFLAPELLSYSSNSFEFLTDIEITPCIANLSGESRGVEYTVYPELPLGLIIDSITGTISGIPTQITALAEYAVTAANSGGSVTVTLEITVNTNSQDDLDIASAKSVLDDLTSLNPVEGTNTDVITMAQALVDAVVIGVVVSISDASGNNNIDTEGNITYNEFDESGDVVFELNKGIGTAITSNVSVNVPANDNSAIAAAKAALDALTALESVEGTDTNIVPLAQAVVDAAASSVTVSVSDAGDHNGIASNGDITYLLSLTSGTVEFALNRGAGTEDLSIVTVNIPATALYSTTVYTWRNTHSDTDVYYFLKDVYTSADGMVIYLATSNEGISISTNGGATWVYYNTDNGLPSNIVNGIYASADGTRIYAATYSGLSISTDSGSTWNNYTASDGLGNNEVMDVFVNSTGTTIYAATYSYSADSGGLSISTNSGSTWTNYSTYEGLVSNKIMAVHASADGMKIFAATPEGLSISTNGGLDWTNKTTDDGLGQNDVGDVHTVANGSTVYAATSGGGLSISADSGSTWDSVTTAEGLICNFVWGIYAKSDGTDIYAATMEGLSIYLDSSSNWNSVTESNGLGDNMVDDIHAGADGNKIFAATRGGLSISNDSGATWNNVATTIGLGSSDLLGLYVSADGNTIYAGTNGAGLSISTDSGSNWINYTVSEGLGDNEVKDVCGNGGGEKIYAAISGRGLSISTNSGSTWTNYTTSDGLAGNWIYGIYTRADGNAIYAATMYGLSISTDSGSNWTNYNASNGLGADWVYEVYANTNGTTIYAATQNGLSISTDSGLNWSNLTITNGLGSNTVTDIYANADGTTIYAGTSGGLSISTNSGTNWTNYTTSDGLWRDSITDVYANTDGTIIYAATGSGLSISTDSGSNWTTYIKYKSVRELYAGVDGKTIYAATDNGLYKITVP